MAVRTVIATTAADMRWPSADTSDNFDYTLDLTGTVDPADSLVSVTWEVSPPDITPIIPGVSGLLVTAWLAGGVPGRDYTVRVTVVTVSRTIRRDVSLFIELGAAVAFPPLTFSKAFGTPLVWVSGVSPSPPVPTSAIHLTATGAALAVDHDATIGGALTVGGTIAGAGVTALLAPFALSSALTSEISRATTAEALLAPKATPTFTGVVTAGAAGTAKVISTPGATTADVATISTNGTAGLNLNGGAAGVSVVGGGPLTTTNGISLLRGLAYASTAIVSPVDLQWNLSGTTTSASTPSLINFHTGSDSVAMTNPATATLELATINYNFGGSPMTGNRTGFQVKTTQTAQSGNLAAGYAEPIYAGAVFQHQQNFSEGGTALDTVNAHGLVQAGNSIIRTLSTATNMRAVGVWEFDLNTAAPSYIKNGVSVVQLPGDVAQGVVDGAYMIGNGGDPATNGWHNGFVAAWPNSRFPYATDGTLFTAPLTNDYLTNNTMAFGINIQETTFSRAAFQSRNFAVDGIGTVRVGNVYLSKTPSGGSLDASGSVGPDEGSTLSGGAIVSGGAGYGGGFALRDPYGGVWDASTVSAGAITVLTCLRTPSFPSATPPANPITLTPVLSALGNVSGTVKVNMPWTQPNVVAIGSAATKVGFFGHAGATQAATPVTLADVIAVIRGVGLAA